MREHDRHLASLENDNRLLNEALATSRHISDDGNQAALALSQAQTRIGLADLLVSEAALASSQAQARIGEANLLASEVALASSKAETEIGLANLLVSATALALSQAQTRIGEANLLASEAALASSKAETEIGLADLLVSATALASSQAQTRIGEASLLASEAALASSKAETEIGLADLLVSATALALSQTQTRIGEASLLASEAALASSKAETEIGLADLLVSANALASSQAQTRIGEASLLASEAALASSKAETEIGLADLLVSANALASSQAQTRIGLADLLASAAALASSEAEMKISLTDLLASAVALASSRAETEVGRTNLLASATALAISRAEAKVGQTDLRASVVANKALSLANGLLLTNEAALEELVKRLEQFSSFAAHDLRSPIASIVSGLQLIERDCETTLGPKSKLYVTAMIECAHGFARQVTSILMTAKAEHKDGISMSNVDLNVVIKEIRFNLSDLIQKTGAIIHADHLPCLKVEPNLFRQLLQNLIENAIKHRSEQLPIVFVQHEANIMENTISIQDNGCGIALKDAQRVFSAFEQVQVARSGTGIGLALCRRVVDLHQGSISIDQNFKDGCRVIINLPILVRKNSFGHTA